MSSLRILYEKRLRDTITSYSLRTEYLVFGLFQDSEIWPSKRTGFYLVVIPTLVPGPPALVGSRINTRISHIAHTTSIQLAVFGASFDGTSKTYDAPDYNNPAHPHQ